MVRLYALLFIAQVVLTIAALISCLAAEEDAVRALPRLAWAMIILLFPLVGPIAWFLAGRPAPDGGTSGWGRAQSTPPLRPPAPDDDPEFLRSLDADRARRDQPLPDQWEADPHRREGERHRPESDDPPPPSPES